MHTVRVTPQPAHVDRAVRLITRRASRPVMHSAAAFALCSSLTCASAAAAPDTWKVRPQPTETWSATLDTDLSARLGVTGHRVLVLPSVPDAAHRALAGAVKTALARPGGARVVLGAADAPAAVGLPDIKALQHTASLSVDDRIFVRIRERRGTRLAVLSVYDHTGALTAVELEAPPRPLKGPPPAPQKPPLAQRPALSRRRSAFKDCYERVLRKDPTLEGKIVVEFTIEPEGHVGAARAARDTMHNKALTACVLKAVKRMRFPRSSDGPVTISNVFVFQPHD